MLNFTNVSRWKAAGVHLTISVIVAVAACLLILLVWYPGPMFSVFGGMVLLRIMVGVDVCLGPLLTLIVFNPQKAKKLIVLDLSIISAVQLAALCYGLYTTFEARPLFVVYYNSQFAVVTNPDVLPSWFDNAQDPRFKKPPIWGPQWAATRAPQTAREESDFSFYEALKGGAGLGIVTQPHYYIDLPSVSKEIIEKSKSVDQLIQKHPEAMTLIKAKIGSQNIADFSFMPLVNKRQNMIVLIDKRTGTAKEILPIDPY